MHVRRLALMICEFNELASHVCWHLGGCRQINRHLTVLASRVSRTRNCHPLSLPGCPFRPPPGPDNAATRPTSTIFHWTVLPAIPLVVVHFLIGFNADWFIAYMFLNTIHDGGCVIYEASFVLNWWNCHKEKLP